MTHKPVLIILIVAILVLAALTLGCNDWDGMDRSGWQPTPTAIPAQWPTSTPRGGGR